jgi:hypothetical protein
MTAFDSMGTWGALMQNQGTERWRKLCEQIATELDPKKIAKLIKELARLLEKKTPVVKENE